MLHFEILIVRFSLKLSFTIAENSKKALIILGIILFYNDLETNINDAKYIRYITSVLYTCGFLTVGRIIELLSYSWIRMNQFKIRLREGRIKSFYMYDNQVHVMKKRCMRKHYRSEQSLNYSWEQKKMFVRCLCKVSNDMRARLVVVFEDILSQSKVQLLRYLAPLTRQTTFTKILLLYYNFI